MVIIKGFIAGLLAFGAFAPLSLWWLAPISMAVLLQTLSDASFVKRLAIVFTFGIGFFAPLLSWSNIYVGDLPWIVLFVLESILLLPIALVPFSKQYPGRALLFPFLLILTEALSSRFPFGGFGWGRIGFSQADAPYSFIARWGGTPALTFTASLSALFIYFLFTLKLKHWAFIVATFILLSSLSIFPNSKIIGRKSIVAIQGGVPSLGLHFNARAREVFTMHVKKTKDYLSSAPHPPEIVFWPENSVDLDPFLDPIVNSDLQKLVDKWKIPLIIGAVLNESKGFSNASILWEPKKGATSIYRKEHLTPFGEYIPLRNLAEFISPLASSVADFHPGRTLVLHTSGNAVIAPIICYELLDDSLGRAMSQRSNLLLVQTNSATFGRSPESAQQLGIARTRAIEHQKYIVSVSTTGISAIITPSGHILEKSKFGAIVALESTVGLIDDASFSDRFGSQIETFLAAIPALWIICFYVLAWTKRKSQSPQKFQKATTVKEIA